MAGLWIRWSAFAAATRICSILLSSCLATSAASSARAWRASAWMAVAFTTGSVFSSM